MLTQSNLLSQVHAKIVPQRTVIIPLPVFCKSSEKEEQYKPEKGKRISGPGAGKWTLKERMKYMLFLIEFRDYFQTSEHRKKFQVFSKMSKYLHTRKTCQCKSHHQKVLRVYSSVDNIINHYKEKFKDFRLEWDLLRQTQDRLLIEQKKATPESEKFYKIFVLSTGVKIQINTDMIESF